MAEGTDAQLHHGAVVEDLGAKHNAFRSDIHKTVVHSQHTYKYSTNDTLICGALGLLAGTYNEIDKSLFLHGAYILEMGYGTESNHDTQVVAHAKEKVKQRRE